MRRWGIRRVIHVNDVRIKNDGRGGVTRDAVTQDLGLSSSKKTEELGATSETALGR